jgi:hypothetical protein
MKKIFVQKLILIFCLAFFTGSVSILAQSTNTSYVAKLGSKQTNDKDKQWTVGMILGAKTINSLFIYDYGLQVTKSISFGHRISLEANYRTSLPIFEQSFGSYLLNFKADIGSPIFGISYEWFPFKQAGGGNNIDRKGNYNFLRSLKVKAGTWFMKEPIYRFEINSANELNGSTFNFNSGEIGWVKMFIETKKVQPFIGLGYDRFYVGKRINIAIDGGLLYQGTPMVSTSASNSNLLSVATTQSTKLQNYLVNFQIIPYLQVISKISF